MAKVTVWAVAKAMVDAGLFTQEEINNTRRIVIDLEVNSVPILYIERYADDKLLGVFTSLDGITIITQKDGRYDRPGEGTDAGHSEGGERGIEGQDQEDAAGNFSKDHDNPGL